MQECSYCQPLRNILTSFVSGRADNYRSPRKGAGKSEAVQCAADQLSVSAQEVDARSGSSTSCRAWLPRWTMASSRCWIVSIKAGRLSPSCSAVSLIPAGWPIGYPNRIPRALRRHREGVADEAYRLAGQGAGRLAGLNAVPNGGGVQVSRASSRRAASVSARMRSRCSARTNCSVTAWSKNASSGR